MAAAAGSDAPGLHTRSRWVRAMARSGSAVGKLSKLEGRQVRCIRSWDGSSTHCSRTVGNRLGKHDGRDDPFARLCAIGNDGVGAKDDGRFGQWVSLHKPQRGPLGASGDRFVALAPRYPKLLWVAAFRWTPRYCG